MLEGGDPNAMLGVMNISEANAASQQTLLIVEILFLKQPFHTTLHKIPPHENEVSEGVSIFIK